MSVELSITCWERSYREVLRKGFFERVATSNGDPFCERIALINNVDDRHDAEQRAVALLAAGEISGYRFVEDGLTRALRLTGLKIRHLQPLEHYTDHFLVAMTSSSSPEYVCHWDADARLEVPVDWVSASVDLLTRRSDVLLAQPAWQDQDSLASERLGQGGDFDLGYGFSDHAFVVKRARLAQPVYRYVAPASWWYPTSHLAPIFEQRVDAYMRRHRLLRGIFRPATYWHDASMLRQPDGGPYRQLHRKFRNVVRNELERSWPVFTPALVRRPGSRG